MYFDFIISIIVITIGIIFTFFNKHIIGVQGEPSGSKWEFTYKERRGRLLVAGIGFLIFGIILLIRAI